MTKALWGLDKLDLFRGLNAMELQEIAKIANKIRFSRGDVIAEGDNENRDVYVLIEGNVDIVSLNGVPLYRIAPGETFGELALLSSLKRTARAISRDDSWIILMNIGHLEKLGEEYPEIYKKVSDNIIRSLGIKLARANKLIELLKSELSKALKSRS
ncbi:MAG: Crp/Fnr family transcriptional regulator [Candidatus Latescibacterota bacterium]